LRKAPQPDPSSSLPHKAYRYMSTVLQKQSTPKSKKMLDLKIDLNAPTYDAEGKVVHDDDIESESDEECFDGVFNAHLLEEEVMDEQEYNGSMSSYGS
jgi:hypothetical protein